MRSGEAPASSARTAAMLQASPPYQRRHALQSTSAASRSEQPIAPSTSRYHGHNVKLLDLSGSWIMTDLGSGRSLAASVPDTVAATLLEHQEISDPYWRENEDVVQPALSHFRW
jgi:hypothetical protein